MDARIRRAVAIFLPLAFLATLASGLAYVETQQELRSSANDPQFQLAEDAAARLDSGARPTDIADTANPVDIATSLSPFVTVFDANGTVLASNATLDGGQPVPPRGVLQAATGGSPPSVTWQPRPGVRVAAVTIAWKGGTVMAGRSLRRVEQQEWNAQLIAGAAWLVAMAGLAVASAVAALIWPSRTENS